MTEAENKSVKKQLGMCFLATIFGVTVILLSALSASYLVAKKTAMNAARNEGRIDGIRGCLTFRDLNLGHPPDYIPTQSSTYLFPRWVFKWRLGDGMVIFEVVSIWGQHENTYFSLERFDDIGLPVPDPEELFKEHLAFIRELPIPSEEKPIEAVGVLGGNESTQHILDLLSPDGLALLCEKARKGTIEERVIATRLYSWYTMWSTKAGDNGFVYTSTAAMVVFVLRCAQLVDNNTMLDLCNGLKSLRIPPHLKYRCEEIDLNVNEALKGASNRSGLRQPATPTTNP